MLHAAVLRSPHAHARVGRIDASRALAAPGVRAAVVPGDVHVLEELAGFQGAAVAAVAADTERQARAALELIDVEWEVLEPLVDPEEAVARGALHGEPRNFERGDVERGLAEADVVIEAEYRTQTVLHSSMETHQAVCEWRGDSLDVYISTQFIWGVRDAVASKLDLPPDKVRVVCEFMGGGFGSKNGPGDFTFIAAELAKRTGRPVRCALDRREENLATGNRNATIQRLSVGARSDGTLVALTGEFVNATGWGGWTAPTYGPMEMLYDCENVRTLTYSAKLNTPPMLAFRAPGFVEGTFGLESLLDALAAKLDIDPLELRKLNYAHSTDDRSYSSKNLMECYRLAEPHWERGTRYARAARGRGSAASGWRARPGTAAAARPRTRGCAWARTRARSITAMQDIGTGTATTMAQIAAEELGLPLDRVDVGLGDSARGPYAAISAGSSTTPSMGPAVRAAAADVGRQIIEIAAQRFDREERVLSLKGGKVVSADGGSWPIEEVVGLLEDAQLLGKGARGPNPTACRC